MFQLPPQIVLGCSNNKWYLNLHTQPKLVGMTNKKLVQMVSHWTSVILVMLARLAYWTTVKLVMTSGLGKPRQVMTDGLA